MRDMSPEEARLYVDLHRGHPGDVAFYVKLCAGADRVVELGCGAGRLAIPVARSGASVVGIDVDEGLLGLAANAVAAEPPAVQSRLRFVCADLAAESLPVDPPADRVLLPYNTLLCLPEACLQRRCLGHARRLLRPGGELVLDVYDADLMHEEAEVEPDDACFDHVVTLNRGAEVLDVYEQSTWRREEQRLDTTYRFVTRGDGAYVDQVIAQRYLLADELSAMLAAEGFAVVHELGGFGGEPRDDDSEVRVVVAT